MEQTYKITINNAPREVTANSDLSAIGKALELAHEITPAEVPKEVWIYAWGKTFHVVETPTG